MILQGKTVVLGVTGGIAAYKAAALCSQLVQAGADVRVIMTQSAVKFIAPLTFQSLSRNPVIMDTFDEQDPSVISHIDLADRADIFIIAPATANIIAKIALGIGDDMLSTTLLATTAPVVIAPAMNVHMYAHPAVIQNMLQLQKRGVTIIEPGEGLLACGYEGKGRLAEPEEILTRISSMLLQKHILQGKKVLVTAGGTIERIDPVRYLTNDSSGKMGYAIANTAKAMGADVTLISGETFLSIPEGINVVPVLSAEDMYQAVMKHFPQVDVVIKAAAVADYRPIHVADRKIKKKEEQLTLQLEKTPDILKTIGEQKAHQFIVGFAAETDHIEQYAMDKLKSKNCDLIVANDVTQAGAGFGTDTNAVQVFDANGVVETYPVMRKQDVAENLLKLIAQRLDRTGGQG